ncbi:MAG: hypothetical protein K2P66_10005 [Lachnospiraceae bacterium]|nr:hypothetical protein [Lachnospiraceae bacterium]
MGRGKQMTNLILFVNAFLSYLLVFVFIIAVVVVACIIGVKWRKSKDAKAAVEAGVSVQTDGNTAV